MRAMPNRLRLWSPRILGILASIFIGMFALDAFGTARPMREAFPDFLVHLIPAATVLALVIVSWRLEWVGGLAFAGLAISYSLIVGREHADWAVVISGPLLILAALYFWSWQHRRLTRTT